MTLLDTDRYHRGRSDRWLRSVYLSMSKLTPTFGVVLVAFFIVTAGNVLSTNKTIGQYFGMKNYMGVVPEHVKAAVLEQMPFGSSRNEVERTLKADKVGVDKNTACKTGLDHRELVCKLPSNHHFWEILRETYTLSFYFDSAQKLRGVAVQSRLFWIDVV